MEEEIGQEANDLLETEAKLAHLRTELERLRRLKDNEQSGVAVQMEKNRELDQEKHSLIDNIEFKRRHLDLVRSEKSDRCYHLPLQSNDPYY